MKKGYIIFGLIVVILLLIMGFIGYKYKEANDKYQENKNLYCSITSSDTENKIELYFDFKDGKAYRYTQVFTNTLNPDFNLDLYKERIAQENDNYNCVVAKIWADDNNYILTEVFNLDEKNNDELKELGFSDFSKMSREELIDNIEVFGGKLECN